MTLQEIFERAWKDGAKHGQFNKTRMEEAWLELEAEKDAMWKTKLADVKQERKRLSFDEMRLMTDLQKYFYVQQQPMTLEQLKVFNGSQYGFQQLWEEIPAFKPSVAVDNTKESTSSNNQLGEE